MGINTVVFRIVDVYLSIYKTNPKKKFIDFGR